MKKIILVMTAACFTMLFSCSSGTEEKTNMEANAQAVADSIMKAAEAAASAAPAADSTAPAAPAEAAPAAEEKH